MSEKQTFEAKDIVNILPHRYPFLLLDRIIDLDLEKGTIVGIKNVTINESFFQGHFPAAPIMPGVLILEALAQAGGVLVHMREKETKVALLLNVAKAKFRNPVRPGDTLYLHAERIHFSSKGGRVNAKALINNETVAVQAEVGFALVDKEQI